MTDTIESINLEGGKYTLQLSQAGGQFKFQALRHGEPWRDMSSDGDKLMLAMFHQLREQEARIAELEAQAAKPASSVERTMRRWEVEEGSQDSLESEITYVLKMDAQSGMIDVRPAGIPEEQLHEVPHLYLAIEINKGVPCLFVFDDAYSGEVIAKFHALPGEMVAGLETPPDIKAIGEDIRVRVLAAQQSSDEPSDHQAPRA